MTIIQYIASPFWGGGEQYVYTLSQQLILHYHYRIVFICQPHSNPELIQRFAALGKVYTLHPRTKNAKFSLLESIRLAHIARMEKATVLHIHAPKEYFLAIYTKLLCFKHLRIVATRHLVESAKTKWSWLWAYKQIDCLLLASQLVADVYLSSKRVYKAFPRTFVLRNSTLPTASSSKKENLREIYHLSDNTVIALFHGRICCEKGIISFLQGCKHTISSLPLVIFIAGKIDDTEQFSFQNLLQCYNGKIHYLGFRSDIATLIPQIDFGLVPSLVSEAGGPLSLLDYMAYGKPTIASDNGSQPEYLRHGIDGFLCPPTNYQIWQSALIQLTEDAILRKTLGANAQLHFQTNFSYTTFLSTIVSIYETDL